MTPVVLAGALAIDLVAGEPPEAFHPVVWMGRAIAWFQGRPIVDPKVQQRWGSLFVAGGAGVSFGLTWGLLRWLGRISPIARLVGAAALLKTTFAVRALGAQALAVKRDLDDPAAARAQAQQLVSRSTAGLDPCQLIAVTIESVAENTLDSIVAPLFWFALLGVPGAMAYRFVNTADAMIGYHGRFEYLGHTAAKLDDALNWLPARLTALLLIVASGLAGFNLRRAWQVAWRDHALTASPNAGWTMAAAAGALAVPLEKVGHYQLGDDPAANLVPGKIVDSVILMAIATALSAGGLMLLQWRTQWPRLR